MPMHLVIFEGSQWKSLAPLSLSRPTFALVCGMTTLLEKQLRFLTPQRLTLWVRPELADRVRTHILPSLSARKLAGAISINEPLDDQQAVLIDGSTLYLAAPPFPSTSSDFVAVDADTSAVRQAAVTAPGLSADDALRESPRWRSLLDLPNMPVNGKSALYLWDLLGFHEEALRIDAAAWQGKRVALSDGPHHLINKDQVLIQASATLAPGCVIDASKGPAVLSAGCLIGANAVIQGPCFIGENTEIMPLSLIRPGTSIGPSCRIGGELARAIVLGNSNKAHQGFLGDSYLGEWINLGAGTNTSNLKNTYGHIGMYLNGNEIDTGRQFLGSIIGDHTKTAIGTRFMSGSYAGYCSMIATSAHAPRFTPSFSFLTDQGTEPYRLEKAFEVARAVFARRGQPWTDGDKALMRYAAAAAKNAERVSSFA
jgi:UDP-N-acetylglucosamine diphosphorylase/glucosamine-1-phosphate N-acetyltransferase